MNVAGRTVGSAISAAVERPAFHRDTSSRRLRVRIMTQWGDDCSVLMIDARIAVHNNQELVARRARAFARFLGRNSMRALTSLFIWSTRPSPKSRTRSAMRTLLPRRGQADQKMTSTR